MDHPTTSELRQRKEEHLLLVKKRLKVDRFVSHLHIEYTLSVTDVEVRGDSVPCVHLLWHGPAGKIPTRLKMDTDYIVARDADGYYVEKNRFDNPGARVVL